MCYKKSEFYPDALLYLGKLGRAFHLRFFGKRSSLFIIENFNPLLLEYVKLPCRKLNGALVYFLGRGSVLELQKNNENPKGVLQEFLQGIGKPTPQYACEKEGKDNAPVFRCVVTALGKSAHGEGNSKKQAEQNAARALLEVLTKKR